MALFLFVLTLTVASSWQEEFTEKSLNQMLDQLIEETVVSTYSTENLNNSRIIYIKQDNITRRNHDMNGEYDDLDDLVHQIENSKHNTNQIDGEGGHDIAVQVERTSGHYFTNDGDKPQEMDINEILKLSKPHEDGHNKIVVLASNPESNLIHKYPEIIIDKISYEGGENINEPKLENLEQTSIKHLTDEDKKEVAAKTLGTLMKIIMKGSQTRRTFVASKENELENIQRSTHIHNAYHNHVINNVPLPYSGLLSRGKMSLGKLPEDYGDLEPIINRPRSAYLDSSLQLSRWGGNMEQSPLMSISRGHNRNRVHLIPNALNILPRVVFSPLFRRKYI